RKCGGVEGSPKASRPLPCRRGAGCGGSLRSTGAGWPRGPPGRGVPALVGWGGSAGRTPAPAAHVFAIPDAMSFEEGAAFGLVYQTSYCALVERAGLQPGESLLVHGAAGGVGLAAVQLGKALGARVLATAGTPAKLEIAQQAA